MPKKTAVKEVTKETVAAAPKRAAKPKTVVTTATASRVKSVKHSKAAAPVTIVEIPTLSAHEQIAQLAYGYWEARGYEHGHSEQDWLRAEQEYLLTA